MPSTLEAGRVAATASPVVTGETLPDRYRRIRQATAALCEPLSAEDCQVQSMDDASPVKWHLAHTSWFFETFVLERRQRGYTPFDPHFRVLFNSYYQSVGAQYARPRRGLLSRPTLAEVWRYRAHVDRHMATLVQQGGCAGEAAAVIDLGLHHEQQHQELILTDVKHLLSCNPLQPAYRPCAPPSAECAPLRWVSFPEGVCEIGHAGPGFAFDNEGPRHRVLVHGFALASRLVTTGEFRAFIEDGGYARPELWLSDGWKVVRERGWRAPLYWEAVQDAWFQFTLGGFRPVDDAEPVTHVSLYEADAYARWADARLPTEAEWEMAAAHAPIAGNFVEDARFHPAPAPQATGDAPVQLFGDVWEWTQSPYTAYPGFKPAAGAIGEYNAKFMANQYVLRGGSCATPRSHIRATYRNFFPADARWQFSGIRLATDG
jgi:ergothioneine biosynthesis protein EgtB